MELKEGSRVRVRRAAIAGFKQPWRKRFESGREGTVVHGPSQNIRGWLVEWDHGKVKYPQDWRLTMRSQDLVIVE